MSSLENPPRSWFRPPYSYSQVLPSHWYALSVVLVDCKVESTVDKDGWLSATISPHPASTLSTHHVYPMPRARRGQ
jgi:hypothetical protein